MLISQPGSDYQLTEIPLDLGRAHDITCLLTDVHGLLTELCADGARPQATTLAQACLRECDSPYTLPGMVSALDEVITELTRAMRNATRHLQPPASQPHRLPILTSQRPTGGARSKENQPSRAPEGGSRSKKNCGPTWD